jgi:hypothetical protein
MRRAIFDPYAIALGQLRKRHREILSEYCKRVLPQRARKNSFKDAPDEGAIRTRWEEIVQLAQDGRNAKGRNLWDQPWEDGVASYVKAFDRLSTLNDELSGFISNHRGERQRRHQTAFNVASIVGTVGTIVFGILSVWMVADPTLVTTIRAFFALPR